MHEMDISTLVFDVSAFWEAFLRTGCTAYTGGLHVLLKGTLYGLQPGLTAARFDGALAAGIDYCWAVCPTDRFYGPLAGCTTYWQAAQPTGRLHSVMVVCMSYCWWTAVPLRLHCPLVSY